ncbi:MAG: S-layer homology domain-containing protein [Clostridia bacterium]|nr:S-layer homology domain-containing protein [Clostridia bacterium]
MPQYEGAVPAKPASGTHNYTFTGWSPVVSAVTGDAVYTAVFSENPNSFTITWQGGDAAPLTVTANYGDPVTVPDGFTPVKNRTAEFSYVFTGWSPEVNGSSIVTGDASYAPVFDAIRNKYSVTWKNYDGSVLETDENVPYGDMPQYDGAEPEKPEDDTYNYVFTGWSPDVSAVTGNAVYTAVFTDEEKPAPNKPHKPHKPKPVDPAPTDPSGSDPVSSGVSRYLNAEDHFGYIAGYTDGTVRPESKITRAETAALFCSLLLDKKPGEVNPFSDISADAWYSNYVLTLHNIGAISGYTDGTYRPNNQITRAEFTAIAVSFAHAVDEEAGFPDVPSSHWAEPYINSAAHYGWVTGYPDGTFRPGDTITRAEAITIINGMLDRRADVDYVHENVHKLKTFSDLKETAWYYHGIMEAANTHDHTKEHIEIWHD